MENRLREVLNDRGARRGGAGLSGDRKGQILGTCVPDMRRKGRLQAGICLAAWGSALSRPKPPEDVLPRDPYDSDARAPADDAGAADDDDEKQHLAGAAKSVLNVADV